jgi:hypothetical protein
MNTHELAKYMLDAPDGALECSVDVIIDGEYRKVFGEFTEINSLPSTIGFGGDIAMFRFDGSLEP